MKIPSIVRDHQVVAFEGVSRENNSSSFSQEQLTKRIHGKSDKFDEEEALQAPSAKMDGGRHFYLEWLIGFTITCNRPLCAVLWLLERRGRGGVTFDFLSVC